MRIINTQQTKTVSIICVLLFCGSCIQSFLSKENKQVVTSPNERISVFFSISDDNKAYYRIEFSGREILRQSRLGIIREDEDFSNGLSLESVSGIRIVKDEYEMLYGKRRHCSYIGNRRIFRLKNASGKKMDVIFQDGIQVRPALPVRHHRHAELVGRIGLEGGNFR